MLILADGERALHASRRWNGFYESLARVNDMLLYLLGAGVAGWLAGESVRQKRMLGQRGFTVPRPQPFTEAPDWPVVPTFLGILLHKLNEAHADLLRYEPARRQAERQFDALEEANAPREAIRQAGAEAQDLAARVDDAKRRIEQYEGELEDLAASAEEAPAPPPVYRGVPIPPALPPPPLPWPRRLPEEGRPIVSVPFEGRAAVPTSFVPTGMPKAGTVGPAVSVAAETAQMPPTPTIPARRAVSVAFGPTGGGMAFTGT